MRAIRVILYDTESWSRFNQVTQPGLHSGKSYQIRENDTGNLSELISAQSLAPEAHAWNGITITPSQVIHETDEAFSAILALLNPKGEASDGTV
jgi:hypothetical protein